MGCSRMDFQSSKSTVLLLLATLLLAVSTPMAQANLNQSQDGGQMYLSCLQDNQCFLTAVASGEEVISNNVFASPAQTETVTLEFDMDPQQFELALLPNQLKSMELDLRFTGEFSGYNKPKRARTKTKKFAVLAKEGNTVKLVRFGDANMTIKKDQPKNRKSFRARHKCDQKKSKLTAGYWSCKKW